MPKPPSLKRYYQTVGEISVLWNYLERDLHVLGFTYLGGDSDVAGRIFGAMGNVSKTDFIRHLIYKYEKNEKIKDRGIHFLKAFDIIRENRNTIEHSVPSASFDEKYMGKIAKSDRYGIAKIHVAPLDTLKELLSDIKNYRAFVRLLCVATLANKEGGEISNSDLSLSEAIASLEKPPLPRKLEKLPHQEDH